MNKVAILILGIVLNAGAFDFDNPGNIRDEINKMEINVDSILTTIPSSHPNYEIKEDWDKIVGGVQAIQGEFPFIVSLQTKGWYSSSYSHFCGGSLIKDNWVLTAAHCVEGGYLNNGRIVAGLYKLKDDSKAEKFTPAKIITHPNWDSNKMDYDFALVKLDKKSKYTPINLNNMPSVTEKDGVIYTVAGWGTTSENGSISNTLMKVDVPFVNKEACRSSYSQDNIEVTDRMLCAGFEEGGKDSCQGDSGGPLIYKTKDAQNYYLVGVVSWGIGCARPHKYGVYSRVSEVIEWINNTINSNQ